jgi:hypothetical protein
MGLWNTKQYTGARTAARVFVARSSGNTTYYLLLATNYILLTIVTMLAIRNILTILTILTVPYLPESVYLLYVSLTILTASYLLYYYVLRTAYYRSTARTQVVV